MRLIPVTVLIDDRERAPYSFSDIILRPLTISDQGMEITLGDNVAQCIVDTFTTRLPAGDYSLPGQEEGVAVERKSLADLYQTLGNAQRRFLFRRELARLNSPAYRAAAVVVEGDWRNDPAPAGMRMPAHVIARMIEGYQREFPRVAWSAQDGRREAEVATLLFLLANRE